MAVRDLYSRLIQGWNQRDGVAYAAPLAHDAEVIGFDGSVTVGRDGVAKEMHRIFHDHQTARYVVVVKSVRSLANDTVILRAAVGMIPPGASDLMPDRNAWHVVVALRGADGWEIAGFQCTPAEFHGRPQLVEQMTDELRVAMTT